MARRVWLWLAVAVLAAAVAVTAAAAARRSAAPVPSGAPDVTTTVNPSQAPVPPAHGAYLGAFVGPDVFTQASEILAVDSFQHQIGRKLSIVHTYLKWRAPFPTRSDLAFVRQGSTLLISWAGTDTGQIVSGADDGWIRARARQIKALGQPVFLEWRWEMDRPNLRSQVVSGARYVRAWDRIRAIFAAAGVQNAAWVWCPTARGFSDGQAGAFYPGDHEVDWVCADAYPQPGAYASFASTVQPFLRWAARHDKPVMIGEFGVPRDYSPQQRAGWLRAAQQVVGADRQIKALVYFDADPAGRGPEGSYSLAAGSRALAAFASIARQAYFSPARSIR